MNIKGKIVTLRAPELADVPELHKWSNDPEIWKMLAGWHFPFSSKSTEDWIRNRDNNSLTNQVFCIEAEDGRLIGTANLVDINWKNKNATNGIMIGASEYRGTGHALDTLYAIMDYAFMQLGLNRLDAEMIEYNRRSIDFYEKKAGWKIEGIRKNWFYRDGKYHDKVLAGITADEYKEMLNSD